MKSRNGIYYSLDESDYILQFNNIKYVFSSPTVMNKFYMRRKKHQEEFNAYMSAKYGMRFELEELADIILYSKMEKRGFKIIINGREYRCQSEVLIEKVSVVQ